MERRRRLVMEYADNGNSIEFRRQAGQAIRVARTQAALRRSE